ncbi:MAG: ribulose phosphate epimerase [Myxococcota bacterium]
MFDFASAHDLGAAERRPVRGRFWAATLLVALPSVGLLAGCEPRNRGPSPLTGDDDGSTSDDPGSTSGGTTGDDVMADGSSDGGNFILPPEGPIADCSVWAQDCPQGEKCMPWANDGGNSWNALKCVEVADDPGQPGDTCTVEGSGVSGVGDCDLGSMCWDVDAEIRQGTCVAMCTGDPQSPTCDDPDTSCTIVNDGVLTLCLYDCDPLIQDCATGQACYPVNGSFTCAPDASGPELGTYGDPCGAINACDVGLFCALPESVPGCDGSGGCCSDFCDLEANDPLDDCSGAAGGQECLPWFDEGEAPPGAQAYGACAIPST